MLADNLEFKSKNVDGKKGVICIDNIIVNSRI